MALREITKKVVSYCEIPEGLIDKWLIENYPELEQEESFFIHLDY